MIYINLKSQNICNIIDWYYGKRRDVKTVKAKKHLAGLTASCMILTMLFGGAASADSVTVTADRLNIRKEASASSKAVGVVDQNETLSFVSESGDWFQVRTGSKEGFVSKEFVALDMSQLEADVEANTEAMSASGRTTDRLNMRALPMTKADIVKVIPKNSEIDIIGACGVWYEVEFSGKTGYVMGQYLTEIEEDTGAVVPPESNTGSGGVIVVPPATDTETAPPAAGDTGASQDVLYAEAKAGETTARVNLRSAPTTASDVIKVVGKGDEVSLTGENGSWYKVNAGGAQGYLSKTYVEIKTASGGAESVPNGDILYAEEKEGRTTERVNMRKNATTSSSIVKVINGSRTVTVTGENGSWYKVEYGGRGGYIAKAYLTVGGGNAGSTGDAVIPDDFVSYPAARTGSTTTEVNLRDAASTSSNVIRVLSRNSSLTVMGEQGGFYQVKYGSAVGYIAKEYVKLGAEGGSTGESGNTGSSNDETIYSATKAAQTTVKVNMRREPEGDVLFTLPQGTKVTLIGEKGSWYKAIYSSSTGYISKAYVEEEAAVVPGQPSGGNNTTETVPDTSGEGKTAYITAQSLNMRKGPGTGYSVIKVLYHGAEIRYYSLEDGWYLIKAGNDTGYVSQKYVSTTKPSVAPSQPDSGNTGSNDDVQVGKVQQADWWTSNIQKTFKVGLIATVTDVDTGLSWQVKRSGGSNHADVQPLTAADTAKMKQAYGGTWSWNRRAIWVTIDGVSYAASMNGMPHGTGSITTNNFDGHHCIHFLNSRTHTGNRWDTQHQAMVQKAYKAGQ